MVIRVASAPSKCYIGSAINLKRRFNTHYKSYKNNKHPKFYSCVNKYSWSNFGFKIIEIIDNNEVLLNREQFWLDVLFHCPFYSKNTLNLSQFSTSWKGNKHTLQSKFLISLAKKGQILTEEHRKNISLGKLGEKHHYYGKKRTLETIKNCLKVLSYSGKD